MRFELMFYPFVCALLILLMLPFTFVLFPAAGRARLDRVPWYDIVLFFATAAANAPPRGWTARSRAVLTRAAPRDDCADR